MSNHLSSVPARQDLQPQRSGDLNQALSVALKSEKVATVPEESLKEVLRLIMVKVGLREANWPQAEEKQLLLSHIRNAYGGHTLKEILLAFEMGMAGQLEVEMTTYENFSCLYVSNVMNAYRQWAKGEVKYVPDQPAIEHKEDLSDKAMEDWLTETARQVKEEKLTLEFMPVMLYDWLKGKGLIEDSEIYHLAAAKRIRAKLEGEALTKEGRAELKVFSQMWNKGEFTGKYLKVIPDLAKKIVVWNHIHNAGTDTTGS